MYSFLETERAKIVALELLSSFKESSSYSIPSSSEYPLTDLKSTQMFAVLIAKTKDGEEKILYG